MMDTQEVSKLKVFMVVPIGHERYTTVLLACNAEQAKEKAINSVPNFANAVREGAEVSVLDLTTFFSNRGHDILVTKSQTVYH